MEPDIHPDAEQSRFLKDFNAMVNAGGTNRYLSYANRSDPEVVVVWRAVGDERMNELAAFGTLLYPINDNRTLIDGFAAVGRVARWVSPRLAARAAQHHPSDNARDVDEVMMEARAAFITGSALRRWHRAHFRNDYTITDARCVRWFDRLNKRVRAQFDDDSTLRSALRTASMRLFLSDKRQLYMRYLWLRLLPTLTRPGEQALDPVAVRRAVDELVSLVKRKSFGVVRTAVGHDGDFAAAYEQAYGLGPATCHAMGWTGRSHRPQPLVVVLPPSQPLPQIQVVPPPPPPPPPPPQSSSVQPSMGPVPLQNRYTYAIQI
jgi:hypothetical protein